MIAVTLLALKLELSALIVLVSTWLDTERSDGSIDSFDDTRAAVAACNWGVIIKTCKTNSKD